MHMFSEGTRFWALISKRYKALKFKNYPQKTRVMCPKACLEVSQLHCPKSSKTLHD